MIGFSNLHFFLISTNFKLFVIYKLVYNKNFLVENHVEN